MYNEELRLARRRRFKYEYSCVPKEDMTYVDVVLRLCFHKFAYGVGDDGETVVSTNADPDEFRRIMGRAKCLRLYDETGEEHMTEEEVADGLWCSSFNHYYGKDGGTTIVEGFDHPR